MDQWFVVRCEDHLGSSRGLKEKEDRSVNATLRTSTATTSISSGGTEPFRWVWLFFGGGGSRGWDTAIRHILPLAEGDGRGGSVALALPGHVHTRDIKSNSQAQSCSSEELDRAPQTSHRTPERGHSSGHAERCRTNLSSLLYFFCLHKRRRRGWVGGVGGGLAVEKRGWRIRATDPVTGIQTFFFSWQVFSEVGGGLTLQLFLFLFFP